MQPDEESLDSELTELLQIASVRKVAADSTVVELKETSRGRCPRCRRYTALSVDSLCERCETVVNK